MWLEKGPCGGRGTLLQKGLNDCTVHENQLAQKVRNPSESEKPIPELCPRTLHIPSARPVLEPGLEISFSLFSLNFGVFLPSFPLSLSLSFPFLPSLSFPTSWFLHTEFRMLHDDLR